VWPAALLAAAKPLEAITWRTAMAMSVDPAEIVAMGYDAFAAAVRADSAGGVASAATTASCGRCGPQRSNPAALSGNGPAALERSTFAVRDWHRALDELDDVEARMLEVLDALELTELVCTIDGLSPVGAAAILDEVGDPARFDCARTWVKHAGLCPRANESGDFTGQTKVSGRGRPALRTAAWRAVWGVLHHNAVWAARYQHLRTRTDNPLNDGQTRAAIAAALLRQLFVVVTRHVAWNPAIAAGEEAPIAA
jgi:transposase